MFSFLVKHLRHDVKKKKTFCVQSTLLIMCEVSLYILSSTAQIRLATVLQCLADGLHIQKQVLSVPVTVCLLPHTQYS